MSALKLNKSKVREVLKCQEHRPWVLPQTSWDYYQEWKNVVFLHWEVPANALQALLPNGLEIDVFNGTAWVSLVCFGMRHVRPRNLPSCGRLSNFDEINLRTYVKKDGKSAVYFLSIQVDNFWASCLARWLSGTPYQYTPLRLDQHSFSVFSKQNDVEMDLEYEIGKTLEPSAKDVWLTERYALFQDVHRRLVSFDIHHKPWPLQELNLKRFKISKSLSKGLFTGPPQLAHYSSGVETLAWSAKAIKA